MVVIKDLSTPKRNEIVQYLLEGSVNGKPLRGKKHQAIEKFSISRSTVYRLWEAAKKQRQNGGVIHLQSGKLNFKKKKVLILDTNLLTSIQLSKRGSIRTLAKGLGQSKSTVGRWVRTGAIRTHTSAIKPNLTAPNKLLRLRFALGALELDRILDVFRFRNMHNTVHIDEKWFYITQGSKRFYMAPEEVDPHRTCRSKNFIKKIMFICAVSRPLISATGLVLFNGKIGIFPFIEHVPAKRKSRNREAGTLETKPIDSITREVMRRCFIDKLVPAIMDIWPAGASKDIYIQQDNARPHINDNDEEFRAAATKNGFNIRIVQQPPNSPDCNVNDLGWFRAIQSLQVETSANTVDELIHAVINSFNKLEANTLNNVFLSLQGCMIEIMKIRGQNSYKIPHMGKGALIRADQLPKNLEVPMELVIQCLDYLKEAGCNEEMVEIMAILGL